MEETGTTEISAAETTPKETPMGPVWLIVIGTMLVSSMVMFGWHINAMRSAANDDVREVDAVRARIAQLTEYKGILTAGGIQTAEEFLKNNPTQKQ